MTKRILAFLLCLLMVLSAFLMSACDKKDSSDDDDESTSKTEEQSKIDVENATPEEIFKQSISNVVADLIPDSFSDSIKLPDAGAFTNKLSDFSIGAKLEANKLVIEGVDVLDGKSIKANADITVDGDNYALEANLGFDFMGEKPSASAIVNSDGIYITEALGALDKSLYIEAPIGEYIDQIKAAMDESAISEEDAQKIADAIVGVIEAIEKAIDKNVTDAAYTTETKTVTIDGVEFKDARVVTLTITPEIMKSLATDVVNDVLAIEDLKEFILSVDPTFDAEQIKGSLADELEYTDLPTIQAITTVSSEGDVVGFDVIAAMEGEEEVIKLEIATVGDNFKLKMGVLENGEITDDYIAVEYTYDEASKAEKFVISIADQGERVDYLVIEGSFDGKKHEGLFTINIDGEEVSFKYVLETTDNSFSLNVKDISAKIDGATVTIPVDATVYGKATDTEVTFGVDFKLDMEGTAEVDASVEFSIKACDVTIKAPANYTNVEEMTDEDLMNLLTDVSENFPNIMSFIEDMMTPESQPEYSVNENVAIDPDYDYETDYDDDIYDYDVDSTFESSYTIIG